MNENQPSNKSHPTASSKKSRRWSASKERKRKAREEQKRLAEFSKAIDESSKQRQPLSHSSGPVAPRGGTPGTSNKDEVDFLRNWDNGIKQQAASTDQQNELENETSSSEGNLTQDMADITSNKDEVDGMRHKQQAASTDQQMMSTTEDSSACKQAAQSNSNNDTFNNNSEASQAMRSTDSDVSKPPSLTEEQKARMEENRLKALEIQHQKKMMKQQSHGNNEVAKKPHPHEATMQVSIDSRSTSAAKQPSLDSSASSKMRSTDSDALKPPSLSEEQQEMIARKKQRALELRRRSKMMNQQSPAINEVAKKPHPHEATRQVSIDSRSTSAATKPSLDSSASSRVMNAPIAPQKQKQHPLAAMKRNNEETEMKSAKNLSHEATRQSKSATTKPSLDSSNSYGVANAQISAQKQRQQHPPAVMKRNCEEMETASARMLSQDSIEPVEFFEAKNVEEDRKKESRRKSGGVTLTQLYPSVDKKVSKKMKVERQTFPTDDFILDWHRGQRDVKFMKGDVWKSSRPEFEGWLFLVEHINRQNGSHVAKVHSYMPLEKTFIGQQEAAKLQHTGYELVKKHDSLLANGYIKLKDLSERIMPEDIPPQMHLDTRHLALRYEEDEDTVSYYTKLGTRIGNQGQTQKPRVLDGFAGGGGMSVGIGQSGYFSEKSYKLEMDPEACETLRTNFPESTVFQSDIRDFNEKFRRGEINLFKSLIDWLHLSPPCQGFSRVNTSGGEKDIQNNNCTLAGLETFRLVRPSHFTMENVPGILDDKMVRTAERSKRSYLQELVGGLLSENQQVRICKKLNAKNYGDPQDRERVFLHACEKGYALLSPPAPTHGKEPHLKDVVTARDVLSDLENVAPTNDGKVWLSGKGLARGHYSKDTERALEKHDPDVELQADLPSRTVRKKNQLVHYNLKRNVTILERARLMSFPDTHEFKGKTGSQSDQIGNAIPVCMATAIANAVAESFRLGLHEPPSPS